MANEVFPGITIDPQVVHGRPVIAGTRVPVEVVVGELAGGSSFDDVTQDYHLTDEQIRAALAYAAHMLGSDVFTYAQTARATLITQDLDLERDTGQFPLPHPGVLLVELPQDWPREHKIQRILAALRSLAGQSLQNALVIVEPSQTVVRRR